MDGKEKNMMTSKKQLQLAKWATIILLIVGLISYIFTAYAKKSRESQVHEPIRILYKTPGGNVLFDHKIHTLETKYGLSCTDCHHHPEDEEEAIRSCNFCHLYPTKDTSTHPNCLDCHDQEDVEGVKTNNQVDTTHSRGECIKCHNDFGKGPVDCETCHSK
jgi:hypothetical protein